MPRLLDTRLIGRDIADVSTTSYNNGAGIEPGSLLQVARNGISMEIGPNSDRAYISKDAEQDRSGISLQQYLCTSWTDITPSSNPFSAVHDVTYANGVFWAVGANGSAGVIVSSPIVSTTGNSTITPTWTVHTHPFTGPIFGITFENGKLVACGSNGQIGHLTATGWTLSRSGGTESIYRIAYGHRKGWVAVGTSTSNSVSPGVTLTSVDAESWQSVSPALGTGVPIYGVTYGDGRFVAVGGWDVSVNPTPTNHIATSMDGVTWQTRTSSQPSAAHYAVTYGNGRFVVGGVNMMVWSQDGDNWFDSSTVLGNIQSVIYGNGMFVGTSTIVYGSVTGEQFDNLYTAISFTATAAGGCYGNGIFVMGSRGGEIIRSGTAPETIGGAQGPAGSRGPQGASGPRGEPGPPGSPASSRTVVVHNTSALNVIGNTDTDWVFNMDTGQGDSRSAIVINVPTNTTNAMERMLVQVNISPLGLADRFLNISKNGGLTYLEYPLYGGSVVLEFFRFPNQTFWYHTLIYAEAAP